MMQHKFVDFIPDEIKPNILYVSMEYGTVVHKCCCGCGEEVVTPLTPTDWKLLYDGNAISLSPSIGNWSFKCRSHYFIKYNDIKWCGNWNENQISTGKAKDMEVKKEYYSEAASKDSLFKRILRKLGLVKQ